MTNIHKGLQVSTTFKYRPSFPVDAPASLCMFDLRIQSGYCSEAPQGHIALQVTNAEVWKLFKCIKAHKAPSSQAILPCVLAVQGL